MSRPATKQDLVKSAGEQFDKMWELIDSMTEQEQAAAFHFSGLEAKKEAHWTRDKNLRDVLVHLYEWHQLLLNWVESNHNGEEKPFLPEPFNWKTCAKMNIGFWGKNQATALADSKTKLLDSHKKVMEMIEGFSNEELFENKYFTWTGTTSLGSYCISATSSHYDWAIKKIRLHVKACKAAGK